MNGNKQLNESQKRLEKLRKRAEEMLDSQKNSGASEIVGYDQNKLIHELLTYQAELELQFEELLETQGNLQRERDNFSRLFNEAPVAYIIIDSKAVIKRTNREFADMLDIDLIKIGGKPLIVYVSPSCHALLFDSINTVSKYLTYETFELELSLRNGTSTWVQCELKPYMADDTTVYMLLAMMDITKIKVMEEELLHKNHKLTEMNLFLEKRVTDETDKRVKNEQMMFESKKFSDMGMMLNAIAHQWRQPLNVLSLIIQDMMMDMPEDVVNEKGHLQNKEIANETIEYMSETINDFLSFFRDNSTDGNFNVVESITSSLSLFDAKFKQNAIELNVTCKCADNTYDLLKDKKKPNCIGKQQVKGNSSKFKQVIMNLLQNPIDIFEERKTIGIVTIKIELEKYHISVSVEDNAGGITVSPLNKIFDPYFTTKHKSQGTGIGLYMSKVIIEDYFKGHLTVMNTSVGAKFIIRLPLIQ